MNALFRRSLFIPCMCEIRIVLCLFFLWLFKTVFVTDGLSEPIRSKHVENMGDNSTA